MESNRDTLTLNPRYYSSGQPNHDRLSGRILQERSLNVQHESHSTSQDNTYKAEDVARSDTAYPLPIPRYLDSRADVPSRQQSPAEVKRTFDRLWACIWEHPKFRKYREGHIKHDPDAPKVEKWPLNQEVAFFKGLAMFIPMQKKKEPYPDPDLPPKRLGRNELIAAYMNDLLGFKRFPDPGSKALNIPPEQPGIFRKQVSSHIQVLKAFLKPQFDEDGRPLETALERQKYDYVSKWLDGSSKKKSSAKRRALSTVARQCVQQKQIDDSCYPTLTESGTSSSHHPPILPLPHVLLPSQFPAKYLNTLKPDDFHMYLQEPLKKVAATGLPQIVHTFTRAQRNAPEANFYLDRMANWQSEFPQLAEIQRRGGFNCPVFLGEASLLLTKPLPHVTLLGISSTLSTEEKLDSSYNWETHTCLFENHRFTKEFRDEINEFDEGGKWFLQLTFGADYWSKLFAAMMQHLRSGVDHAAKSATVDAGSMQASAKSDEFLRRTEEDVRRRIKSITAVQEVLAYPKLPSTKSASAAPHRAMLIYWRFRQTETDEPAGITTWRKLIPPEEANVDILPDDCLDIHLDLSNTALPHGGPHHFSGNGILHHDLDTLSSTAASFDYSPYAEDTFSAMNGLLPSDSRLNFQSVRAGHRGLSNGGVQHFMIPGIHDAMGAELMGGYDPFLMLDTDGNVSSGIVVQPDQQSHPHQGHYQLSQHIDEGQATKGYHVSPGPQERYHRHQQYGMLPSQNLPAYSVLLDGSPTHSGSQQAYNLLPQYHPPRTDALIDEGHDQTHALAAVFNDPGFFVSQTRGPQLLPSVLEE